MKSHFRTLPTQLRSELERDAANVGETGVLQRGIHGNSPARQETRSTCLPRCKVQLCTQRRWPAVALET